MTEQSRVEPQVSGSGRAVFRIPATALLAILFLVVCITPVALSGIPGLQALYVIPLGLLVFVLRVRTVATAERITIRTLTGQYELTWSQVKGFRITRRGKVEAVLVNGTQLGLPTVRARHLPVLSAVSGGRLADPSGVLAELRQQGQVTATVEASRDKE